MLKKVFSKVVQLSVCLFAFCFFACQNSAGGGSSNSGESEQITVQSPVISPAAGDYSEGFKTISISAEKSEIEIYYTTDGTEPSETSNRYTEPFTIIGSKTVKAVAVYKEQKSSIVSASYNLNAGKTASQLGVLKGKIGLAENFSKELQDKFASSTIYITSSDLPGVVKEGKMGDSFYIDGLDTTKFYDFYFSNKAPGTVIDSRATGTVNSAEVIAIKLGVTPSEEAGTHLDVK